MSGKLFLLAAPSGGGKTTVVTQAIKVLKPRVAIERVITYTTRQPRPGDQQGIDYHFLSTEEFEHRIAQNFFLEWSMAYGAYYGTPSDLIERIDKGSSYIAIVDCAGVRSIKKVYESAIAVWLDVSDIQVLESRLRKRGSDTEERIQRRLALAQTELTQERLSLLYHYRVINDVFDDAVNQFCSIIEREIFGYR